jgi:hypothetical protein
MLALLDRAENADCDIPVKFSPSLTRIKTETGLSHASVVDGLAHLELHGWLSREQRQPGQALGTRGAGYGRGRVHYRLIPDAITPCSCQRDRSTRRLRTPQKLTHLDRSTRMPVFAGQSASRPERDAVTRGVGTGAGKQRLCRVCGGLMDPILPELGYSTHPNCDEFEQAAA